MRGDLKASIPKMISEICTVSRGKQQTVAQPKAAPRAQGSEVAQLQQSGEAQCSEAGILMAQPSVTVVSVDGNTSPEGSDLQDKHNNGKQVPDGDHQQFNSCHFHEASEQDAAGRRASIVIVDEHNAS